MLFSIGVCLLIVFNDLSSGEIFRKKDTKSDVCPKINKGINPGGGTCLEKFVEFVLTSEDLNSLQKANIVVKTDKCRLNPEQICLSTDSQSLIGAGAHGVVVRGSSKKVPFGLAVKFVKLPAKLDLVSFNVQGRYNRIDLDSLKKNQGREIGLREAVALRLLTEYEISSIPRYVTDIETKTYRILAMESIEGYEELSKVLDKLSTKEIQLVSCQISAIVCNFDRISLGHDDLHERNILINRKNLQNIFVIDFGGAIFSGQTSSAGNFLKQPINLLGHLRRSVKEISIDRIQSNEKKVQGNFCSNLEKSTSNEKNLDFDYQILFTKYFQIQQNKKKFFKCTMNK